MSDVRCSHMTVNLMPLLGTVIVALLGWIVAEQRALRSEVGDIRSDVANLREHMARLEGLFEGFTKREAA